MKEWYSKLRLEYQVSLWSSIVIVGAVILCIPFFFFSLMEIPQGIALGGGLSVLIYIVLGLINNEEKAKRSLVLTIIVIFERKHKINVVIAIAHSSLENLCYF